MAKFCFARAAPQAPTVRTESVNVCAGGLGGELVRFNVGGRRYDVSRSLLNMNKGTMIYAFMKAACQRDPNSEVYIERNGERFQYCLDYLRSGKVDIPFHVSKEALISDFQFCGIKYMSENIFCDYKCMSLSEIISVRSEGSVLFDSRMNPVNESNFNAYQSLAHACMLRYKKNGALAIRFDSENNPEQYWKSRCIFRKFTVGDKHAIDQSLNVYGFQYVKRKVAIGFFEIIVALLE